MGKGGLSFLNKKSWHTQSFKNVKKVWEVEQKAKKEAEKLAELRKEREEERQISELRQLQAQSGLISQRQSERLDWMYQAPLSKEDADAEEYLLGEKVIDTTKEDAEEIKDIAINMINSKTNTRLEEQNRLRDDPLMGIIKKEQQQTDAILSNPIHVHELQKKAKIIERIKKEKKKHKKKHKKKKHKKKHKKKKHKKKRRRSYSSSSDSASSSSFSPSRSRSNSRNYERSRRYKRHRSNNETKRTPHIEEEHKSQNNMIHPERQHLINNISKHRTSSSRNYSNSSTSHHHSRYERNHRRSPSPPKYSRRSRRYSRSRSPRNYNNRTRTSLSNSPNRIDEEEKRLKLLQMMEDARKHKDSEVNRLRIDQEKAEREEAELRARLLAKKSQQANFLQKMNKQLYTSDETLESRLSKYSHYRQKGDASADATKFI